MTFLRKKTLIRLTTLTPTNLTTFITKITLYIPVPTLTLTITITSLIKISPRITHISPTTLSNKPISLPSSTQTPVKTIPSIITIIFRTILTQITLPVLFQDILIINLLKITTILEITRITSNRIIFKDILQIILRKNSHLITKITRTSIKIVISPYNK